MRNIFISLFLLVYDEQNSYNLNTATHHNCQKKNKQPKLLDQNFYGKVRKLQQKQKRSRPELQNITDMADV